MLEHARREQLGLIRRRAAVRVLERHDLSLLSDAEAAPNRARGLCRDRPPGRGAAPAHRAPAAVEEGDGNAALAPQPGEPELSLGELPVGRQKPAVLVGVGVADHHLEHPPLFPHAAAHQRDLEQLPYHVGGAPQVVDRLEQRDDGERTALGAGGVGEEPGLLREHVCAEHVGDAVRHAQHEAADGLAIEAIARLADQAEHARRFGRPSLRRQVGRRVVGAERPHQLRLQPGAPLGGLGRGRLGGAAGAPQRAQCLVQARGVLADVQSERAEPEGFHLAAHRPHEQPGRRGALRLGETRFQGAQVDDEVVRGRVAVGLGGRLSLLGGDERGVETAQHAGEELPEHLARVAARDGVALAGALELTRERRAERRGDHRRPVGDAQRAQQLGEPQAVAAQAGDSGFTQGAARRVVRDERIAVPVPADPAADLEKRRHVERCVGVGTTERLLELVRQLGDDAEQVLVDEVQPPGELLLDRRLLEAQLAGEPQQLDLGPDVVDQRAALPGRPARGFQVHQAPVDAAVLFQHGHALGFGGVRRDDRSDAQSGHQGADLFGRHAGRGGRGDHLGERATHLLRAALHFGLPSLAHGGVLLGDGEELEPGALRLDRSADELRGRPGRELLTPEHALDVGLMCPDHVEEAVVQQARRPL